ncbi:MAG: thymidine phosphorylase [Bdellovibrionales bacterium RIFOXYB1_FULL_37_110]|nr:MAG: thymidine phosphorylase [Bdellovibrionales bacterium RIFOXYA1_FULL_38_20]OFZ52493.1 MAG: thymidine phosphorylase [Bdellovibrionales bacterium RIFOXYC1_FULL_37_79]OFZ59695.1 MAG: thymidine phosphorylase [Bdellovibrionales bacterium RIFOXYB1_FULL_37_110]OFZ62622.1 MAG: thymidine phosphorylase [Bdellovibrionales bacterium RIFOXYD1_FULL_36_51]
MIKDSNIKLEGFNYSPYQIIQKKRDGKELTKGEIEWFINSYTSGDIPDYQMAALLMAIYLKDMSVEETKFLTDAMLYSGQVLNFNDQKVIDKHSTGGVGDKTSFILGPIAASCGVKVPMIAGRGLGHTGGTVDKIECIENFNTSLSLDQLQHNLDQTNIVLIGQTKDIAPADKKIYALRDVTATVESIPLITASIMSKKLAEGTSGIVMDIKTGSGAFMKNLKEARALAKSIRNTALRFNKNIITMLTDMNQPLGNAVGNSLEIIECIETLKGKGPKDLTHLSVSLAGGMIYLAGLSKTLETGIKMAKNSISNGKALAKFRELIISQGGSGDYIDDYTKFPVASNIMEIKAPQSGYLNQMDGIGIGLSLVDLGGGRKKSTDKIDFAVGIIVHKKLGDKVTKDHSLASLYYHDHQQEIAQAICHKYQNEYVVIKSTKPKQMTPLIMETKINWSK